LSAWISRAGAEAMDKFRALCRRHDPAGVFSHGR
jgi:hypothetical protein